MPPAWLTEAGGPIAPCWLTPTADSHLSSASTARRRPISSPATAPLLTRHTGLLTREVWQRQFAPAGKGPQQHRWPARSGRSEKQVRRASHETVSATPLIAPLLLALSLRALASGVDTYEFRHSEQTRAQELAAPCAAPSARTRTW